LEEQRDGNYHNAIRNQKEFITENKVINYVRGVEIKMTKTMGRGVFASRDLLAGDIVCVELAAIEVTNCGILAITELVSSIIKLKGVNALRISYLYDGQPSRNL
jgi:hypothetical protein